MTTTINHKHRWFVHLVTALMVGLFLTLGIWQLGRGNFKVDVQEEVASNHDEVPQKVSLPLKKLENWRYQLITLQGYYLADKQFLLDNQIRDQQPGYSVLSVFHVPAMNTNVLVDRGWVAQGLDRTKLPEVNVTDGEHDIVGSVYVPYDKAFSLGGIAEGEDAGWPRRVQFIDYEALGSRAGAQLQPFTLRLDARQPNGYRRDWSETHLPASKHYGYAFQWFAMATAVIVLWWINLVRPRVNRAD